MKNLGKDESMSLEITLVQFEPVLLDIKKNLERAVGLIDQITSSSNPDIILFPELFLAGYTFKEKSEVEGVSFQLTENEYLTPFIEISRERSIAVCGGYSERDGGSLYNSSFFIADGKIVANYRKVHLFHDEADFFAPGDTGFSVFEYRGARLGMMICFDWIFPEAARTLALKGAQVILHPANLVLPYCQRAMYARALENRVFIATANRVGRETNAGRKNSFTGGSQVVSPKGEYILTMSDEEESFASAVINPTLADNKKITEKSDIFATRRVEFYK
jgi:predicted amidohydrolase